MDCQSHSPAKNSEVHVDCSGSAVPGGNSHSSGKATRLFLALVFVLLLFNLAGLSFSFWRLREQEEQLSQLQGTAALQTAVESRTVTVQRRGVPGETQDDPQRSHGHGTHAKLCHHGRCKTGKNDERPPPMSLGVSGLTSSKSTNFPSGHLVLGVDNRKFLNDYHGAKSLPFREATGYTFLNNMLNYDGGLQALAPGIYFIYAQVEFLGAQSTTAPGLSLYLQNNEVAHALAANPTTFVPSSTVYVGRLICMNKGDLFTARLGINPSQTFKLGMNPMRSFLGTYYVSPSCRSSS